MFVGSTIEEKSTYESMFNKNIHCKILYLIITKRLLEKFFNEELELVHRDKTERISLWATKLGSSQAKVTSLL